MLIEEVRVTRYPMQRVDRNWKTATYAASSATGFALELTSGSVTGLGATSAHPRMLGPDELFALLDGPVRERLIGADALNGSALRAELAAVGMDPRAVLAVDLALHDMVGRLAGLPSYAVWGGRLHAGVDVVRMVGIKDLPELETAVGSLVDEGFRHVKIKIGTTIQEDVDRVSMVRAVFGDQLWIAVDGNGHYDFTDSIELCQRVQPFDIALIEQPVPYQDIEGLAKVTAASPIPVLADQYATDAASARELCEREAANLISVKLTKMGSIDECRRVATICDAFGVDVHIGGSMAPALVDVAAAHLAVTLPGLHQQAEVGEFGAATEDAFTHVPIVAGRLQLDPSRPGWGVELRNATPALHRS